MTLPKRRAKLRMNVRVSEIIRCPGHLQFVRGFQCAIEGKNGHECVGKIESHHVISRGAGGGDEQTAPLCSAAHMTGHAMGWTTFGQRYGVDLTRMAAELWKASPHRLRWERSQKDTET